MQKFGKFCVLAGVLLSSLQALANPTATSSVKLLSETPAPLSEKAKNDHTKNLDLIIKGALSALNAGMPSLAQSIVENTLLRENLSEQKEQQLMLILSDAHIAQGKFESALKTMANVDMKEPDNIIRMALIHIGLSNHTSAKDFLDTITEKMVSKEMLPWYYIAKGYVEYEFGNMRKALDFFKNAKSTTATQFALADIMIAENFCKLAEIDSKNENPIVLENTLRENVKLYFGTPAGFQFAKQLSAVLFKLGKKEEALEVINQQLEIELSTDIDKNELRLISAAMTKNPEEQENALKKILELTVSNDVCDYAMAMLAKNPNILPEAHKKFLISLEGKRVEGIHDRILLELAKVSIKSNNNNDAIKYATNIIDKYSNSRYKKDALRILAWSAYSIRDKKNHEYRLAASYLSELANLETDKTKADEYRFISADCYFLNNDFSVAAKKYEKLLASMKNKSGFILNRAIEANLKCDDYKSAIALLDNAYPIKNISDDEIWNGEWKIISYLREKNLLEIAKTRVEQSIKSNRSKSLLIKMRWLSARIAEELGEIENAISQCDNILNTLQVDGIKDALTRKIVASNAMLMKARCLESLNRISGENGASAIYQKLRTQYPKSDAAKVSYLYQARMEASLGNFANAQHLCSTLAETDPNGIYLYDAITNIAKYSKKIGTDQNHKTALAKLDKLCNTFPNDPRNFYARILQAEMLRLLKAFDKARKLYEEIINQYNSHPEIHLAWFGLGDCAMASKSNEAITIYERLYALPNASVATRAEAAYKCAKALDNAGRNRESDEFRWLTSTQLLAQNPTALAKYWISRSLFDLAEKFIKEKKPRDAKAIYEMIVKHKLPSHATAEAKQKSIR